MAKFCPSCGKEVVEGAKFCTNCGAAIDIDKEMPAEASQPSTDSQPVNQLRRTPLGTPVVKKGAGIASIVFGIIAVLIGIPLISIIIGIFVIIGGLIFIGSGINGMQGTQTGKCPYCQTAVTVNVTRPTFKCPHCKKVSKKCPDALEEIK